MYIKGELSKREFVSLIDQRSINNLLPNLRSFVKAVFPKTKKDTMIFCKYINNGKVDIEISDGKTAKRIMIKSGLTNIIHHESFFTFMEFLKKIGLDKKSLDFLKRNKYCMNDRNEIISRKEFLEIYHEDIERINEKLVQEKYLRPILNRIFARDYYEKEIHYLYYGSVLTGEWLSIKDLKKMVVSHRTNHQHKIIRIGNLKLLNDKDECLFKVWNIHSLFFEKCKSNP